MQQGPQFYSSSPADMRTSIATLLDRGYAEIGRAEFEAGAGDYSASLRAKAKEVQADIVVVASEYARTDSGVIPLVTYQPGQTATTYSSGQVNASAYGGGGYAQGTANYSGVSTTTGSGTYQTNYVPYSVRRNTYAAAFFRKCRFIIGAQWAPLNDQQRQALGRNTGLVVTNLVEGSPAFLANLLPGDVMIELDGTTIAGDTWLRHETEVKAGQVVKLTVLRKGERRDIEVHLNPDTF